MEATPEQTQAVELFLQRESLKIEALAGTGKTASLVQMCQAAPRLRGLYLAFNKSIALEAQSRLESNVICMTTHELAFKCMKNDLGYPIEKLSFSPNTVFFESVLKEEFYEIPISSKKDGALRLTRRNCARLFHKTFQKFFQSADPEILLTHIPSSFSNFPLSAKDRRDIWETYGTVINSVWERMMDCGDPFPLGHDGYLKVWALLRPDLEAEYLMLDEVQDTSDVVLNLLSHQKSPVVYVGDSHQQIYEWRGAVDAISKLNCPQSCSLTTSFRFGQQIAALAGGVITRLGSLLKLKGFRSTDEVTNDAVPTKAILCRYNKTVMEEADAAIGKGQRVHVIGGTDQFLTMNDELDRLEKTGISDHPDLFGFHGISELRQYCAMFPDSAGWPRTVLKLRNQGLFANTLRNIVENEQDADVLPFSQPFITGVFSFRLMVVVGEGRGAMAPLPSRSVRNSLGVR